MFSYVIKAALATGTKAAGAVSPGAAGMQSGVHREDAQWHVDKVHFPGAKSSCKGKNLPGRSSRGGTRTCASIAQGHGFEGSAWGWDAAEQRHGVFKVTLIETFGLQRDMRKQDTSDVGLKR